VSNPIGQDQKLAAHNFFKEIKDDSHKRIFALDNTGIKLLLGKDLGSKCDTYKEPYIALQNLRESLTVIELLQKIENIEKDEEKKNEIEEIIPLLPINGQLRNMVLSLKEKPYDMHQIDKIKAAVQSYVLVLLVIQKGVKKEDYDQILNLLRSIRQSPLKETCIISLVEPNDYKELSAEWEIWKNFERAAQNYWDATVPLINVTSFDRLKDKVNDSIFQWEKEEGVRYAIKKSEREADQCQAEGRFKKAIEIYEKLFEKKRLPNYLLCLMELYFKDKNLSKFLETFERIKKLDPEHPFAHFYLGEKKISGKKEKDAEGIKLLKKSVMFDPALSPAAAKLFRKKGLIKEIINCLGPYLEDHPWDIATSEILLEALWEENQLAAVQSCIHLVLKKKADMQHPFPAPIVYLYLGLMEYEEEETKNLPALLEFEKVAIKEIEETTKFYHENVPVGLFACFLEILKTFSLDFLKRKKVNKKLIAVIKSRYFSNEDKGQKRKEKKAMINIIDEKELPSPQKLIEDQKIKFFECFVKGQFATAKQIKKKLLEEHEKNKEEFPKKIIFKNNLPMEKLNSRQCFLRAIEHGVLKKISKKNSHLFLKVARLSSNAKNTSEMALQYFHVIDQFSPSMLKSDHEKIKELKIVNSSSKRFSWEPKETKKKGGDSGVIKLKRKI